VSTDGLFELLVGFLFKVGSLMEPGFIFGFMGVSRIGSCSELGVRSRLGLISLLSLVDSVGVSEDGKQEFKLAKLTELPVRLLHGLLDVKQVPSSRASSSS
jgi:hypothetical protein